jgi:hypothetical protein
MATRDDILNIKRDIGDLRKELGDSITKFKDDISLEIRNSVKWIFVFGISQFGATMAVLLLLLKK